jgi:hypothetical protein
MALLSFLRRDPVAGFWRWFETNAPAIAADVRGLKRRPKASRLTTHDLTARLRRIHPMLVHEVGVDADGDVELIVSADGNRAAFDAVLRTVGAAPVLPGFKVTAFRRRAEPEIVLGMFGQEVRLEDIRYEAWPEDDRMGVRLYIPFDLDEPERHAMGFVLLDMALGEFDVETGLGSIEFASGRPREARRLNALAAEFDAFRSPTLH